MGEEIGPISTRQLVTALADEQINPDTEVQKRGEQTWTPARYVDGLLAAAEKSNRDAVDALLAAKRAEVELEEESRRKSEENRKRKLSLVLSTCGPKPNVEFDVLDTVFAFDSSGKAGVFGGSDADPHAAFSGVKRQLRTIAYELGADAVVSCQFEYRVAVLRWPSSGGLGRNSP